MKRINATKTIDDDENLGKFLTLKTLIAMVMADIDIFLLKNEEQNADKDQLYSCKDVRTQLKKTGAKFCYALGEHGIDIYGMIKKEHFNMFYDEQKVTAECTRIQKL